MQTINVVADIAEWITSVEAARHMGKNVRTVQEYAKEGRIHTKPAGNPQKPHQRLYSGADVARLIGNPGPERRGGARQTDSQQLQKVKPTQQDRALDTVSIVGQIMIAHKAEVQLLADQLERISSQSAKNLENVVSMILNAQRAESDANRERLKAEREDARERWEMERQERIERRRSRLTVVPASPQNTRARKAHA